MRLRTMVLACVLLAVSLPVSACRPAMPASVTQAIEIPAAAERSADISVSMTSGNLRLAGGAAALVEGTATYPRSDGEAKAVAGSRESTAGKVATVEIAQGQVSPLATGQRLMDLRLNGGLPIDLTVIARSGNADLDLVLVDPKDVNVESTSGNTSVRLSGPHPSLSHVSFVSRSGETSIAANGEYPAIESFAVESSSGNVTLDLSGTWKKSFAAQVTAASGNVTLTLPRDVNVRVTGIPMSGNVSAEGFRQEGGTWTLKPEKPSEFTLSVSVSVTSGNLTVKAAEKK